MNLEDDHQSLYRKDKLRVRSRSIVSQIHPALVLPEQTERWYLKLFGIEIVLFLQGMGYSGMSIIIQNFYIDRICRISDNFTQEVCDNLSKNSSNEKLVEYGESKYMMYQSILESGLPIFIALFLGPWTDKYGNKPVILLSLLGYLVSSCLYIFTYYSPYFPPAYILICSIPIAISGGSTALVISTFGFLIKKTSKDRSMRLAILAILWDVGSLLGCLLGAKLFQENGFLPVFIFGSAFYGSALAYALIFVSEDLPDTLELNGYQRSKCSNAFDVSFVKETFQTCFKKRQGHRRRWILILAACLSIQFLACLSKTNYQYLYVRNKFGWDAGYYSNYTASSIFLGSVGGLLMVVLLIKLLKIQDMTILFINASSNLAAYLTFAFATSGWQMYLGSGIQMFGSITTAVIRSTLSKCVSKDEIGKLLSFVTCVELSMPFLAGPIYGLIYMNTIAIFPGSIFITASVFTSLILIASIYLYFSMKKENSYEFLVAE